MNRDQQTPPEKKVSGTFKLSAPETGMYIEQLSNPESTEYNINIFYLIEGVEPKLLEKALRETFESHEVFHSCYQYENGTPLRVLSQNLPKIQWKIAPDANTAQAQAQAEDTPFDLSSLPVRVVVYTLGTGELLLHLDVHHIAFDGSTITFFEEELFCHLSGESPTVPPMDLSDLSALDHTEETKKGLSFYEKLFEGGVPSNEMPLKGPRPQKLPLTDRFQTLKLDEERISQLSAAAKREGVSLFPFLFTAMSLTLAKYCASEDVVIGVSTNTRNQETKDVFGMFVNHAPVRVKPTGDKSLRSYLAEVSETVKACTRTSSLPFAQVVERFDQKQDMSRHPIFDFSINYLWMPEKLQKGTISISYPDFFVQKIREDMVATIHRWKDRMELRLQYNSSLYEDALISRFLEQFSSTLQIMAEHPEATLREASALPLSQAEALKALSATAAEKNQGPELLHLRFEAAAKAANRTALIACDRTLTYGELNAEANQIARQLMRRGVKPGDRVVLLLPRRSFYFSSVFGVLKAGAAFIPCDPEYPQERIQHILSDSGATLILTTQDLLEAYDRKRCVDIKEMLAKEANAGINGETRDARKASNPQVELTGEDLAYMIYTSGSTGVPKGVMLTHRGICNFCTVHPANPLYSLLSRELETMLAVTTVSFDLSLKDTLGVLVNGKTVVFASEAQMNDPRELAELIKNHQVDAMNATPSRYEQYLEVPAFEEALKGLKLVMAGGEPLPQTLLTRLQGLSIPHIINTYGPTETTISSNMASLEGASRVSVGPPLLNVREFVLDASGELSPRGVTGELYIGGPGVARGYRNMPEQTSQRFVSYLGERYYRSGDYARWDEEGNILILGRMDGQVKLRGLRIELGEIEAVMEDFPGIDKAVAAIKTIDGLEHLCAYYVSQEPLAEEELFHRLKSRLTPYMVPRALMRIEQIPVSANGKTDRKALPVPDLYMLEMDTTPPGTDSEKKVYSILAEKTLGSGFGIHVPFAELGVTSLSMVGLMLSLSQAFDRPVSIADLKEHDDVASLAAFLDASSPQTHFEKRQEYPLTQTQYGIYVECVKNPNTTIYNIPLYLKLGPSVDLDRLQSAIAAGIDAHPYLKMRLFEGEETVLARREDSLPAQIKRVKVQHLPSAQELIRPVDLLKDPLYRMELYEAPEGNAFYMELHHILGDGESRLILQRDIERAYQGEKLEPEAFTGYEAALLEEEERKGPRFEKAKQWYQFVFSDAESSTLPPAQPEIEAKSLAGSLWLETGLEAAKLESFCRQKQVTLNTLFNAAYGYTLAAYAWSEEALFTTIYNGRSDSRLAKSVSMLVKTLPVRVSPDSGMETGAYLSGLHDQLSQSSANTIYSFGEISREFGIQADTMLCFQGRGLASRGAISFCGDQAELERPALSAPKTNLTAEVYVEGNQILFRAEYATQVYNRTFVEGFLRCLEQVTGELTHVKTLGEINLMYPMAWDRYERINQTDYPVQMQSVNRLFEEQVRLHPDRTAVIADKRSLTFDQLNKSANRVAHALIALGVGRDQIVGMVLDRTVEIFMAEHGILKAGGAFLPMVPEYPDERIRYCLLNAQSPCVLTTRAIRQQRPALFSQDQPYKTLTVEDLIQSGSEENPELEIPTDSLAYCIYTSGSTGNPKGVMIEHRNLCNYVNANPKHPTMFWHTQDIDCALSVTSISFDMSITERFVSLCNGIPLCMATLEEIHDPRALAVLMREHHCQSIVCTPSYLMSLLDEPEMLPAIGALKAYHVGGEAFPPALIDKLKSLNKSSHVMNGYGPTETTVSCTSSEILPGKPIYIGTPEANVTHYVADKQLRPLPAGVLGELIICGAGVGRGYVKLPERTAASFITYQGQRAYRSGDLVRLSEAGEFEYFGRLDNQVKLRGLRIELDEIESVIHEYPGVKLCKVIVRNNGKEDYLAGFYTAEGDIPVPELKTFLKTRLTPYMVPDALAQLPEMPLTINGKIDKKRLPDIQELLEERAYEPPKNETEEKFCGFFAAVLKQERVSATDNFFEIGGTSLSAAMVVSRASRAGFDVVYKNIFDYPTPRLLSDFVLRSREGAKEAPGKRQEEQSPPRFYGALKGNLPQYLKGIRSLPLGRVLLTGPTGFLGIHVLWELLHNPGTQKVICLIRGKTNASSQERIRILMMYYFGDLFTEELEEKVTFISGDITDEALPELLSQEEFDVILNCAALVKHFEAGDLIHKVNFEGVVRLIEIALQHDARLIQISTCSIAGAFLGDAPRDAVLRESTCDLGQTPATKYSIAKFEAEKAILTAIEERGLRAKILRVGNLMGRRSDGEFQINFRTNGFMNRLKAYKVLGCFPVSQLDTPVEFSPIDLTAQAVVLLSGVSESFTVFHANNCHKIHFANVLQAFSEAGYPVEVVEDEDFYSRFSKALEDETKNVYVSSLVSYNSNATEHKVALPTDNSFTVKALYRLGFSWPLISMDYLRRTLQTLSTLGFFDE